VRELTDVEYDILNAVYFIEPFDKILEDVKYPENIVGDSLKFLITHKYISAMKWDGKRKEHVRSFFYDSDNMRAYSYLITREGLLIHNSK
jgi:hypothetical protein